MDVTYVACMGSAIFYFRATILSAIFVSKRRQLDFTARMTLNDARRVLSSACRRPDITTFVDANLDLTVSPGPFLISHLHYDQRRLSWSQLVCYMQIMHMLYRHVLT